MRILPIFAVSLATAGCSLVHAPPATDFIESRERLLAAPGESYVALSGGECLGPCPVYEIFVFESGRVVFNGKQNTALPGVVERLTLPSEYFELRKLLLVRRAFDRRFHLGCRSDHQGFEVGAVEGERVRAGYLNYGCLNQRDDLEAITSAFIRIADASTLIR